MDNNCTQYVDNYPSLVDSNHCGASELTNSVYLPRVGNRSNHEPSFAAVQLGYYRTKNCGMSSRPGPPALAMLKAAGTLAS